MFPFRVPATGVLLYLSLIMEIPSIRATRVKTHKNPEEERQRFDCTPTFGSPSKIGHFNLYQNGFVFKRLLTLPARI